MDCSGAAVAGVMQHGRPRAAAWSAQFGSRSPGCWWTGQTASVNQVSPGWSWAASQAVADSYQAEASGLVGEAIANVRYLNIDYFMEQFRHGEVGPRLVTAAQEWEDPTWRHPACDTVDFAVELETRSGRCFTVAWDSPGTREGLGIRELRALGNAFREDTEVAVWDVTEQQGWRDLVGKPVSRVVMHYEPWDNAGARWCSWITVEVATKTAEFLLAEGQADQPASPQPSANNVAVIFGPASVPEWLTSRPT